MSQPPPSAPAPKKTNWLVIGCGGCLGLLVLGAIAGGAIFYFAVSIIKSSDAYKAALAGAQNSAEVQEELGTPITAGFMPSGNVSTNNDSGTANLNIQITGPKGDASVHYIATKENNIWQAEEHKVTIKNTGKVIDLLQQ